MKLISCREDWNKMSPTEKGAHCKACQTEVIDFSQSSTDEILQHISKSASTTCGKFSTRQLKREVKSMPNWKRWAIAAACFLVMSSVSKTTIAQQAAAPLIDDEESGINKEAQQFVIKGQIVDQHTLEPLMFSTVQLIVDGHAVEIGTVTDLDGYFELRGPLAAVLNKNEIGLKVTYLGYVDRVIRNIPMQVENDFESTVPPIEMENALDRIMIGVIIMPEPTTNSKERHEIKSDGTYIIKLD